MGVLISAWVGVLSGLGARFAVPGWKSGGRAITVATVLVAVTGAMLGAMLLTGFNPSTTLFSVHPALGIGSVAGAWVSLLLLGSPLARGSRKLASAEPELDFEPSASTQVSTSPGNEGRRVHLRPTLGRRISRPTLTPIPAAAPTVN